MAIVLVVGVCGDSTDGVLRSPWALGSRTALRQARLDSAGRSAGLALLGG